MTKRLLVSTVCLAMATSLMAVPAFAQAPAAAPAAPAPAAPVPAAPAPATPAPAAPSTSGASAPAPAAGAKTHAAMGRGQRVERVQTALNANGAQLTVDGKMGPKTSAALMDFQKAHGLKATGHVDKETMAALQKPS
jgi:peptidoglycan hydrolase-like protein with peptidoglycan-binding domain